MRKLATLPAIALAAGALLALPGIASSQDAGSHAGHDAAARPSPYSAAMEKMHRAMEGTEVSGDPGVDYARMMIPHHESAVEMARAYLASGDGDPELGALSREIVASQEREIETLRLWLRRNGG